MVEEIKREGFMIKKVKIVMHLTTVPLTTPLFIFICIHSLGLTMSTIKCSTINKMILFIPISGSHSTQLEIKMVYFIQD